MKVSEWLECVALMTQLWPNKPMPPDAAEAWYPLLGDLPGAQVHAAIRTVALDAGNVWPPSLGQLRAACEPPPRPWEDALAEIGRVANAYGPRWDSDDEALNCVIDAYGWRAICSLATHDPTVRAQFRDAYRGQQLRLAREHDRRLARLGAGSTRAALPAGGQP